MDNPINKDMFRAGDFTGTKIRWLHMSGEFVTEDKTYSWYGTEDQFYNLCDKYEWDALVTVKDIPYKP